MLAVLSPQCSGVGSCLVPPRTGWLTMYAGRLCVAAGGCARHVVLITTGVITPRGQTRIKQPAKQFTSNAATIHAKLPPRHERRKTKQKEGNRICVEVVVGPVCGLGRQAAASR